MKDIKKVFYGVLTTVIATWVLWVSASVTKGLSAMEILERIEKRVIKVEQILMGEK